MAAGPRAQEPLDLSRPRSLSELIATTLTLQTRWFGVFFTVTALVNVPFVIGVEGVWNRGFVSGSEHHGPAAAQIVAILLSSMVLPALVTALHVRIVQVLARGEIPTVGSALRLIGSAVRPALAATIFYALGITAGFLLLIIPGIIWAVRWYFAPQAAIVDGRHGPDALRRSGELVRGRWPLVAGQLLAMGIVAFAISGLPQFVIDKATDSGFAYITVQAVLGTVTVSMSALFGTLLFFTLRVQPAPVIERRDPFDPENSS